MSLYIHNSYPTPISVAMTFYNPNCAGQFEKIGWYNLVPGQTLAIMNGDLQRGNRYYTLYARATNGAQWTGPFNYTVTNAAFNSCVFVNPPNPYTVGFFEIDINGYNDYTLNFIP